jgi:hypothetical protein
MAHIVERLAAYGEFDIVIFGKDLAGLRHSASCCLSSTRELCKDVRCTNLPRGTMQPLSLLYDLSKVQCK